ncbi:MAG: catalase [Oscillospiraceae bacterium]|nr:catalase [Oscillospiraceae bacterium]
MHPIKHFQTITKHRHLVMFACFRVGLIRQGLLHDLSKYGPTEFWQGAKYWQGSRSPNARAREVEGWSTAWMHHKGRNKHHYEYWTDIAPGKTDYEAVPMPTRYMVESVMDRIAACKNYRGKDYEQNDPLDYLLRVPERLHMHPDTLHQLVFLLTMLRDHGEKEMNRFIRQVVLKGVPFDRWDAKERGTR